MTVEKQPTGFRFGKYKVELLETLGEVEFNGRKYQYVREKVENGEEYFAWRLYNARGKFIKRFLIDPWATGEMAQLMMDNAPVLPAGELVRRFSHLKRFGRSRHVTR